MIKVWNENDLEMCLKLKQYFKSNYKHFFRQGSKLTQAPSLLETEILFMIIMHML
jgi:hypothetical protein